MSNPNNKFNGFFNDPKPVMGTIKPKPEQILEALYMVTLMQPQWYKRSDLRMVVCGSLKGLADIVGEMRENGTEHPVSPAEAAFCMVLGDLALATREEYATDEEKKMFPIEAENEEEGD